MRSILRSLALACSLLLVACAKRPDEAPPAPAASTASAQPSACETLKGSWRIEGFVAASPATSASAAQLNAAMDDQARAVRLAYTGTRVKMWSPGSLMISNAYEVKEDGKQRCVIDVKGERTVVDVVDGDHVTVDKGAANVGAKMRLARTKDQAPTVGPQ